MKEELIISGRDLPLIDPHLEVWHWPISVDLFMGGLAAGILFFAGWYYLTGKENEMPATVKWATFVPPVAISIALLCLIIDLKHKIYFWQLYTTFKLMSPMSLGSWILLFITPLSFLWAGSYIKELIPNWDWKIGILNRVEKWVQNNRKPIAWALILLAAGLGIYTGILLSAFNARPLWNTALLGPMFLSYGLLTGAATIFWIAKGKERQLFSKIMLVLIVVNLFFIVHLFMGFLAGPSVQVLAVEHFIEGEFALPFWGLVVGLGLVIPGLLGALQAKGVKIPAAITAILILFGGLAFRFIMVEAGQLTRYLY